MSNWLFKHDLNAETISQFRYVWVKFRTKYWQVIMQIRPKYWMFMIKMKSCWVYIKSRRQTGYV